MSALFTPECAFTALPTRRAWAGAILAAISKGPHSLVISMLRSRSRSIPPQRRRQAPTWARLAAVLATGFAASLCAASTLSYSFDSNQLPSGWTGNMVAQGGRLMVDPALNWGSVTFNLPGARPEWTNATVRFDIHLGGGNTSLVRFLGATVLPRDRSQHGFYDASVRHIGSAPLSFDATVYSRDSNTFQRLSGTGIGGGDTYTAEMTIRSGQVAGMQLRSLTNGQVLVANTPSGNFQPPSGLELGSFALSAVDAGTWIDNLFIQTTESRQPKQFGLFLGVKESPRFPSPNVFTPLRGDSMASQMAEEWRRHGHDAVAITADIDINQGITKQQIRDALAQLTRAMQPGDSLTLYSSSHGLSTNGGQVNDAGVGTDFLRLGPNPSFWLSDDDLADLIKEIDPLGLFDKRILIDACHAGGMWAADARYDPNEAPRPSLNTSLADLPNTSLFGAAAEPFKGFYANWPDLGQAGTSPFNLALLDTFKSEEYWDLGDAALFSNLQGWAKYYAWLKYRSADPFLYVQAFGDRVPADPDLINLAFASNALPQPVPAPGSLALAVVGLIVAGAARRRALK